MTPLKLFICAAEPSGDRLAACIVARLRSLVHVDARGLAGPRMERAGVQPVAPFEGLTAVGLAEALPVIPKAVAVLRQLRKAINGWQPDVLVTVDAPSLLLRLSRTVDCAPRVHCVAPQVWAWRPSRAHQMHRATDHLLCLFPFEPAWFAKSSVKTTYIGHPDLGRMRPQLPPCGRTMVALSPGSRPASILRNRADFVAIAECLRSRRPDVEFVVPVADGVGRSVLRGLPGTRVQGIESCNVHAALTAPGTATLQWFAKGVPMSVVHRIHPASWLIGRRLVRDLPAVALPNLLAPDLRIGEHLQQIDHQVVANELCELLGERGAEQRTAMFTARKGLRGAGASSFAAAAILRAARGEA